MEEMEKMEERIKDFLHECGNRLERMNTYRTLFFMWLVLGVFVMACGEIGRLNYFCVWMLLLLEYADNAIDEENKRNKRNKRNRR